jgi:hypothetical protein
MRVARPVKPLPQPHCEYCGAPAVLVRLCDVSYPYRDDHGPLWLCEPCQAWIGIYSRSKRHVPLGRLANAELREWKTKLHAALEPMAAAKARRDANQSLRLAPKATGGSRVPCRSTKKRATSISSVPTNVAQRFT